MNATASRKMDRIENPGLIELIQKLGAGGYERVFLAEGDSWFDIFTPAPLHQPNLLDAIRTPWNAAVVDISHVGDTAKEMATSPQAPHTLTLLNTFKFHALLLSAGGNDLKNAFKEAYLKLLVHRESKSSAALPDDIATMTSNPAAATATFDEVCGYIVSWIGLRDLSKLNRDTPVILHGYDYLQPRPAGARVWMGGPTASGPWIHPVLDAAGKTDSEMRAIARTVIDTFNEKLRTRVAHLSKVHLLDTRETLVLAEPKNKGPSNDWMDEIHPAPEGFTKLAHKAWGPTIASVAR